jgi:hypothetical protein
MKKIGIIVLAGFLASCGNDALDGKANTDTTSMPRDPYLNTDTVNHINENIGSRKVVPQGQIDSANQANEQRRKEMGDSSR